MCGIACPTIGAEFVAPGPQRSGVGHDGWNDLASIAAIDAEIAIKCPQVRVSLPITAPVARIGGQIAGSVHGIDQFVHRGGDRPAAACDEAFQRVTNDSRSTGFAEDATRFHARDFRTVPA